MLILAKHFIRACVYLCLTAHQNTDSSRGKCHSSPSDAESQRQNKHAAYTTCSSTLFKVSTLPPPFCGIIDMLHVDDRLPNSQRTASQRDIHPFALRVRRGRLKL